MKQRGLTWTLRSKATAWEVLKADGWQSTTPFECLGEAEGHLCKSAYSTAMVTKGCEYPCFGYQVDWILYKGEAWRTDASGTDSAGSGQTDGRLQHGRLTLVEGTSVVDTVPLNGGCADEECWAAQQAAGTADPDSHAFCSDHAAVVARFRVV